MFLLETGTCSAYMPDGFAQLRPKSEAQFVLGARFLFPSLCLQGVGLALFMPHVAANVLY